mmetsp:Transcript_16211/g.49539  ORF Transcript_16211/g.49539 Transcript_16211/m.49539 type:complete len:162 (-) Transcript_16211:295-780(-)
MMPGGGPSGTAYGNGSGGSVRAEPASYRRPLWSRDGGGGAAGVGGARFGGARGGVVAGDGAAASRAGSARAAAIGGGPLASGGSAYREPSRPSWARHHARGGGSHYAVNRYGSGRGSGLGYASAGGTLFACKFVITNVVSCLYARPHIFLIPNLLILPPRC